MHSSDWHTSAQAIPNLMDRLRKQPFALNLLLNEKSLSPHDPNLIYYPLAYIHGREAFSLSNGYLDDLRRHIDQGGGTLLADAACGSPAFDAAFRRFVAELLPNQKLVPIHRDDEIFTRKVQWDLSKCQYTRAAGGCKDYPQLEGVNLNGRWAIIYSKYGIGCVLDRDHGEECKGYVSTDAVRIGGNILLYSTIP